MLYGSRARGDADDGSDVDLLVVLREDFDWWAELQRVYELTEDLEEKHDYPLVSAFFATERDYRETMLPIYMNIRREGIVLWPCGTF